MDGIEHTWTTLQSDLSNACINISRMNGCIIEVARNKTEWTKLILILFNARLKYFTIRTVVKINRAGFVAYNARISKIH